MLEGDEFGPYVIVGKLGQGGMGELYSARDRRLGREVAIKFLIATERQQAVLRFEQEARAVSSLAHPHVVTVFDVGQSDRGPYIVTELLRGETLHELLDRGPLPRARAVRLALQMLGGLAEAHARGIVHRDLKPSNLFVTEKGMLKILDFGIAKLMFQQPGAPSVRTRTGVIMGTIGYCSPEQMMAQPIDHRTDLYSAGVVLHQMLIGAHPFGDLPQAELAEAMMATDAPPLPEAFPAALREVVRRCEERDRDRRFSSATELAAALEAAEKTAANSGVRRHWKMAAAAAALLAGSAGFLLQRQAVRANNATAALAATSPADPSAALVEAERAEMIGDLPASAAGAAACAQQASNSPELRARCLLLQLRALALACEPQEALSLEPQLRATGALAATEIDQAVALALFGAGRIDEAAALLAKTAALVRDPALLLRLQLGPGDAFASEPAAAAAEARVSRALALAASDRREPLAARARLAAARVTLALGKQGARALAAEAVAAFEKAGAPAWEAHARATHARALAAEGAIDDAGVEASRASALAGRARWRGAQLAAAVAQVAVHAAGAKRFALAEDARTLERIRDDAARAGCVPERIEAEVAAARASGEGIRAAQAEAKKLGYADLAADRH